MKAREIMTLDPFTVTPSEPISRAAQLMRDLDVGCIPVVQDKAHPALVGLLTDRDVTVRCVAKEIPPSAPVREAMTKVPLKTVHTETDVNEVISRMEKAQVRRIPVIDDDGMLLGIIAQADIATKVGPFQPMAVEELVEVVSEPSRN